MTSNLLEWVHLLWVCSSHGVRCSNPKFHTQSQWQNEWLTFTNTSNKCWFIRVVVCIWEKDVHLYCGQNLLHLHIFEVDHCSWWIRSLVTLKVQKETEAKLLWLSSNVKSSTSRSINLYLSLYKAGLWCTVIPVYLQPKMLMMEFFVYCPKCFHCFCCCFIKSYPSSFASHHLSDGGK